VLENLFSTLLSHRFNGADQSVAIAEGR
jgi:hypothetical protein